jgi:hypothetical protein
MTIAGRPDLDRRLLTKTLVSRTTFNMAGPQRINGFGHILFNLLEGNIREMRPDPIKHVKTGPAFGNQPIVRINGYDRGHRAAGALHDDLLAPAVHPSHEVGAGKSASVLPGPDVFGHWDHFLYSVKCNFQTFCPFCQLYTQSFLAFLR